MKPSAHPVFENPPIAEIAIGVAFASPEHLTVAHLGQFWASIAADFPIAEDHNPVGSPNDWVQSVEGLPLPRLWVIEPDARTLLQLQLNRFTLNWRRLESGDVYRDFNSHLRKFMHYWLKFCAFACHHGDDKISVSGAEVLKLSHFREGDGWRGLESVGKVCTAVAWPVSGETWGLRQVAASFSMEHEYGKARFELKSAFLKSDLTRRVFVAEGRAEPNEIQSTMSEIGNLEERLIKGNELANLLFTMFTPPEIQENEWKRTS